MYRFFRSFFTRAQKVWALCLLFFIAGTATTPAYSHGYVSMPESRSLLCKMGTNVGCGAIQWEPQSVEGPDGTPRYPVGGPADGTIAAAGSPAWSELNAQTPSRWYKHSLATGLQTFEWTFTANHVARDWRYFITKVGWDASQPLARAAFDPEPFCAYDGGMVRPPLKVTHDCVVPERSGYHIILAVWDVGDTAASFYNAIDVTFSGENAGVDPIDPEEGVPVEVGVLSGAVALRPGDSLATVVFDELGERTEFNLQLTADRDLSGAEASLLLATLINESGDYFSGRKDGEQFVPELGPNPIYATSPIVRIETRATFITPEELELTLSDVPSVLVLNEQIMADLDFTVEVSDESAVSASIYTSGGQLVVAGTRVIDGMQVMSLHLHGAVPGAFTLVVIAQSTDGQRLAQQTVRFEVAEGTDSDDDPIEESCDTADPTADDFPEYSSEATYLGGETVSFQGLVYRAKWWVRGVDPSQSQAFELVSDVLLTYDSARVYQAGDRAIYGDGVFEAKWWTRGTPPGSDPWRYLGEEPNCE